LRQAEETSSGFDVAVKHILSLAGGGTEIPLEEKGRRHAPGGER